MVRKVTQFDKLHVQFGEMSAFDDQAEVITFFLAESQSNRVRFQARWMELNPCRKNLKYIQL